MGQKASREDTGAVAATVRLMADAVGGVTELAEMVGCHRQAIYRRIRGDYSAMTNTTIAGLCQAAAGIGRTDLAADLLVALGIPTEVIADDLLRAIGVEVE